MHEMNEKRRKEIKSQIKDFGSIFSYFKGVNRLADLEKYVGTDIKELERNIARLADYIEDYESQRKAETKLGIIIMDEMSCDWQTAKWLTDKIQRELTLHMKGGEE